MAPALKALLLAVALAAQGGYALRSLSPLAGGPRHRHIASRPALSRAHSTGDAPIRSAAVQMDASAARSPDPPSGQRTAALRQPRRRIARWVMRTARLVFFSLTLMKMLTFARAVHASSASSVVENPQAQHATKGYKRASGPVASADVSSANRLRQKANAARERRGPELANVVATKAPRASLSQGAEQTGIRAFVAKGKEAMAGVSEQLPPGTTDALVLLAATALVVPMLATLKLSPILGFLLAGLVLGPNGLYLVRDVHTTEILAELGVVFFLFEMGLELSIERLKSLSKDAFGLGIPQFLLTTLALAFGCEGLLGLPRAASLVIGGSLALSSSAFVIQLLQEKGELATRYGRASFGILLLQDIAVVPMLVLVPLLGSGGSGAALGTVLLQAALKGFAALSIIGGIGPIVLRRAFRAVTASKSQEAFVAITLFTVLSMSTFTKALGLSDTLGAFLAGVLLAESKYRYQIEADIAPFRGILFGLFFITIGYAIDVRLFMANWVKILAGLVGLHVVKAGIILGLCRVGGLSGKASIRTGIMLSQAGEFAFVLFGLAQQFGVIEPKLVKLLLLLSALSMSATPFLADAGASLAEQWERRRRRLSLVGGELASSIEPAVFESPDGHGGADGQVLVCGYGSVGTVVCDLLANMFVPYAACDMDPEVVAAAQERGLPVYFGDARRADVLRAFGILKGAKAVVVALDKPSDCLRIVKSLRRDYPDLPIFVKSTAATKRLLLDNGAQSVVSGEQESALLIGAAVLKVTGKNDDEVMALIEEERAKLYASSMAETLASVAMFTPFKEKAAKEKKEKVIEEDIIDIEVAGATD